MKTKITKFNIPLAKPFSYFLATMSFLDYSKIKITTSDGYIGIGEIVNSIDSNGQYSKATEFYNDIVQNVLVKFSTITSIQEIEIILDELELHMLFNKGILCGVEQALFDILSQKTKTPLIEIFGGLQNVPKNIQVAVPFLKTEIEYKEKITRLIENYPNIKFIKFKVGKNNDLEVKAINYIRKLSSEIKISVDANQAFKTAKDALLFLSKIEKYNISWAEQLLPSTKYNEMKILAESSQIPLMADESLHTEADAQFLVQNSYVKYFNIKLAKTGGILRARKIIKVANEHNIPVILGSMLHSEIGYYYNFAFALTEDFVTHDFGSYLSLVKPLLPNMVNIRLNINPESFIEKI